MTSSRPPHISSHSVLDLPAPDPQLSPYTGLTRAHWEAVADQLLLALRPHATEEFSQLRPPGRPSRSGDDSDGLEGFARSFLIAASLQHGRGGADPHGHAEHYARGIAAGVDPHSAHPWPRPSTLPQSKVEACSVALGLDLTREWIWDRFEETTRQQVIAWFREVIGTRYPDNNWVWFRLIVLTFLRSVDDSFADGEDAAALRTDLTHDLRVHESCVDQAGWFTDGPERSVDHYNTWAFAVLPTLWLRMRGIEDLARDGLVTAMDEDRHRSRLALFVRDALGLVGADGSPLVQGRSLVYRLAAAGPFWSAALAGLADGPAPEVGPGTLRRAASGELAHFLRHGVPDEQGLLTLGWHHAFPDMAQNYSGPGSPYWACKGFLGLALPAEHPVWTATEQPLPVEEGDEIVSLPTPGWLVSRTREDGIVRVINHGTDHGLPGVLGADAPLYARWAYSTATCPAMRGPSSEVPVDSTVALVHPGLGWSHRAGFDRLAVRTAPLAGIDHAEQVGIGISRQLCHWVGGDADASQYGEAGAGGVTHGAVLTVASIVRGASEVRVVRAEQATEHPVALAGWPLSGQEEVQERQIADRAEVTLSALRSTVRGMRGTWSSAVEQARDVSPLGPVFAVPHLETAPLDAGDVVAAQVVLSGHGAEVPAAPDLSLKEDGTWVLRWADGATLQVDPQECSHRR
ncbi:DUF2264 domain-containing protein [Brachybacterium tyrofermentans]|uniref:DUF2264 domain-containing protein n=1 Tax=Brachybacterium tyrofermentans TaxID=47848 RepID=UPI003FD07F11